jgi:hypothetical protein
MSFALAAGCFHASCVCTLMLSMYRQTDRQTDRQRDRHNDRQTDSMGTLEYQIEVISVPSAGCSLAPCVDTLIENVYRQTDTQ